MTRVRPILKLVPFMPFARWMACTVVLYFRERPQRVSPFCTVWRIGGLAAGLTLTAGAGLGAEAMLGVLGLGADELLGALGLVTAATTGGLLAVLAVPVVATGS